VLFIKDLLVTPQFLDIKGAFDNIVSNILIHDFKNIGIPAHIRKFILNLISEKQLYFVIDGNLATFLSPKGTPQESTLTRKVSQPEMSDFDETYRKCSFRKNIWHVFFYNC